MNTTWEQLEGAVLTLARSGAIKDRLADAFRNHLAQLNADDLPDTLRAEFSACHDALTRERPLRGEDAVRATVRKMSYEQADEVARGVVRMFTALAHQAQPAQPAQHEHTQPETLAAPAQEPRVTANVSNGAHDTLLNGAHNDVLNGAIALNGALKGKRKAPKSVPQIISLYAAEA
jgi:hypothetical protein